MEAAAIGRSEQSIPDGSARPLARRYACAFCSPRTALWPRGADGLPGFWGAPSGAGRRERPTGRPTSVSRINAGASPAAGRRPCLRRVLSRREVLTVWNVTVTDVNASDADDDAGPEHEGRPPGCDARTGPSPAADPRVDVDLSWLVAADLAAVDVVARLCLAAVQRGHTVCLHGVDARLNDLLDLVGLHDVLQVCGCAPLTSGGDGAGG